MNQQCTIPELDARAAKALMQKVFDTETLDVAVFVDRGWGNSPLAITIIKNGDGQNPIASLSKNTYQELLNAGVIAPNNLQTYKARQNHQFNGSRWMLNSRIGMLDVAEEYPALTPEQKLAVRRAVRRYADKGLKRASVRFSGSVMLSTVRLPKAGLALEFGHYQGNQYVSSLTLLSAPAAAV